jgi:hypothetical protein
MVMPPPILYNKFYIFCIYFVRGWVLVSLKEPFFMNFDLIIVVLVHSHPLQRDCYSQIKISAHPTLTKGLFRRTRLKVFARVMPLFTAGLVCSLPCAGRSLALFKVDRAKTFLILLELKTHHSLIRYYFGTAILDWGFLLGCLPFCILVCNICFRF